MARAKPRGRGRLSSIELLPPECDGIIAWAAQELAGRERTQIEIYQDFVQQCEDLMAEHRGEIEFDIPSFSSFNRYSMRLASTTRRLEETREIAATMAERFDPQGSDDLTRIAAEAIKTLVFELLTYSGEAGMAPKDAMQLANALKAATQAQSVSTERRQKVEKEFAAQVEDAVEAVAKVKGLSAETTEAIKSEILGGWVMSIIVRHRERNVHGYRVFIDDQLGHLMIAHDGSIAWDDIQSIKNAVWGEDIRAIEVYPRRGDVVNSGNFRHLWRLGEGDFCPDLLHHENSDVFDGDNLEHRHLEAWSEANEVLRS